jgi:hypothetical protein
MDDATNNGLWTRLLRATHAVLNLWDSGTSFDSPEACDAMDELAAASAAVDLRLATIADDTMIGLISNG